MSSIYISHNFHIAAANDLTLIYTSSKTLLRLLLLGPAQLLRALQAFFFLGYCSMCSASTLVILPNLMLCRVWQDDIAACTCGQDWRPQGDSSGDASPAFLDQYRMRLACNLLVFWWYIQISWSSVNHRQLRPDAHALMWIKNQLQAENQPWAWCGGLLPPRLVSSTQPM